MDQFEPILTAPMLAYEAVTSRPGPKRLSSQSRIEPASEELLQALHFLFARRWSRTEIQLQDMLELHQILTGSSEFREKAAQPLCPNHQVHAPKSISRALDRLFEWSVSPGFGELHPVEQASLVQVRLYEIQPFPDAGETTANFFSFVFALAGGFPPPLYRPVQRPELWRALEGAFSFVTGPLVDLNRQGVLRSYDLILAELS